MRSDRGDSLVLFALLAPALLLVIGMVYDLGVHFETRLHAQNVAAASARAGANDIDRASLLVGQGPVLADTAADTARGFAAGEGYQASTAQSGVDRITVTIDDQTGTTFLAIIGVEQLDFSVSQTAVARHDTNAPFRFSRQP